MAPFNCLIGYALLFLSAPLVAARPRPAQLERRVVSVGASLTLIFPAPTPTTTSLTTDTIATTTSVMVTTTAQAMATSAPTPTCIPGAPGRSGTWLDTSFGAYLENVIMNAALIYNRQVFSAIQTCQEINPDVEAELGHFYDLYHSAQNLIHEPSDVKNLTAQGVLADRVCDVLESVHSVSTSVSMLGNKTCTTRIEVVTAELTLGIWPCIQGSYLGPGSNKPYLFPEADLATNGAADVAINLAQGIGCRGNVVKRMVKREEQARRRI